MVYNKFAFYVNNRNQQLVPRDESSALLCEWESHPDDVVFQYPYVLAFDPRFIEIRHVETVSYLYKMIIVNNNIY